MPANRVFLRLGSGQRPEKVEAYINVIIMDILDLKKIEVQELGKQQLRVANGGKLFFINWLDLYDWRLNLGTEQYWA